MKLEPLKDISQDDTLDIFIDIDYEKKGTGSYKAGHVNLVCDDEVQPVVVYKSEELEQLEEKRLQRKTKFQKKLDEKREAQDISNQQEE